MDGPTLNSPYMKRKINMNTLVDPKECQTIQVFKILCQSLPLL